MGDNYLQRQAKREDAIAKVAFESGFQKACDLLVLVLRDEEFVGRGKIHGFKRIMRIYKGLQKYEAIYRDAWTTKKEADYLQEKLDAKIREVTPPELFEPFAARHPYIKKANYSKPRKDWR